VETRRKRGCRNPHRFRPGPEFPLRHPESLSPGALAGVGSANAAIPCRTKPERHLQAEKADMPMHGEFKKKRCLARPLRDRLRPIPREIGRVEKKN
jgi:hypothetical protein